MPSLKDKTKRSLKLLVVQINLHHCKAATDDLHVFMSEEGVDIALIQEPWLRGDKIQGLMSKHYQLFYSKNDGKIRSCILIRKTICNNNTFFLSQYSDGDVATVELITENSKLILTSVYMPYEKESPPPETVRKIVSYAKSTGTSLVLGCDANAHHSQWGSSDINERGESVFEYLLSTNLIICNQGNHPTFRNRIREEVLDLTLASNDFKMKVSNWRVSPKNSFSDHFRILFNINLNLKENGVFRNPTKTDWKEYNKWVNANLPPPSDGNLVGTDCIDSAVNFVTGKLVKSYEKFCPISRGNSKTNPPWWNSTLKNQRSEVRKLHRKALASKTDSDWTDYRSALNSYTKEVRQRKLDSWSQFCESITDTSESARLRKVMSKDKTVIGSLQKPDGSWTETGLESLQNLMETHFPGCEDVRTTEPSAPNALNRNNSREDIELNDIITEEKVLWAINSFKPYKSPGPDRIIPAMMQHSSTVTIPWLVKIFKGCLLLGYIPTAWREVKVVYIPKAGKPSHCTAKDFRPISLSSFLLKTLERLLDLHIRSLLNNQNLCTAQHAYLKGKSVETALHDVVSLIEKNLHYEQYTLSAFLDIEGAFNNVENASIKNALEDIGVERPIVDWIDKMLKSRIINSQMAGSELRKTVTKGTPQGGVISPLLWLLVVNKILKRMKIKGVKIVAYADDVVIIISGKHLPTMSDLMQSALKELATWAKQNGLGVNPSKTELVLFTRKYKIPPFRKPKMDGQELTLSNEAKYLGIILDSKLTWKRNTEERRKKALNAFYTCKKTFGSRWGMRPHIIHWMYTAIIRPILTYGALVWWHATETKSYLSNLTKVQRLACMGITGARRSTPQAALEVILNLLPIEIHIKSIAAKSAIRLREAKVWKQQLYGHGNILEQFRSVKSITTTDYISPYMDFRVPFFTKIPTREEWESNSVINAEDIQIFTDGSKMEQGTGSGIYCESLQIDESHRLSNDCSVFQAEIFAIEMALKNINTRNIPEDRITIFVDSQAAIKALRNNVVKSTAVSRCRNELIRAATRHQVNICWVPGHCNIEGNEKADELARKGSNMEEARAVNGIHAPICTLKRNIELDSRTKANNAWSSRDDCIISRSLWPEINEKRTKSITELSKNNIRLATGIITGHCDIGYMAAKMGRASNDYCRSCGNEEELETIKHFLCECPALERTRLLHLGALPRELEEVSNLEITDILNFTKATKWFN